MSRDVIIALDFPDGAQALSFLDAFDENLYVKVGMELFYQEGPSIVRAIKERGHRIFLDLKLHDIPNTVGGGIASLMRLGVDMMNIHIAGGSKMIEAARGAVERVEGKVMLIGVTMLTSNSIETIHEELHLNSGLDMEEIVLAYGKLGRDHGLDGVVCSALEAPVIKAALGDDFITVCPGIRPAGADQSDQVRVTTPNDARERGVDYIVVGRPITQAEDPVKAYRTIYREFMESL